MTHKGIVKWFDENKGYGWVKETDSGTLYFFHYSTIISDTCRKSLQSSDKVEFDVYESQRLPGKLEARNLKKT
jgi:CspA family cold shock protein